jgi:hypothetical protein
MPLPSWGRKRWPFRNCATAVAAVPCYARRRTSASDLRGLQHTRTVAKGNLTDRDFGYITEGCTIHLVEDIAQTGSGNYNFGKWVMIKVDWSNFLRCEWLKPNLKIRR